MELSPVKNLRVAAENGEWGQANDQRGGDDRCRDNRLCRFSSAERWPGLRLVGSLFLPAVRSYISRA